MVSITVKGLLVQGLAGPRAIPREHFSIQRVDKMASRDDDAVNRIEDRRDVQVLLLITTAFLWMLMFLC